jgi:hypothetical protein
MRIERQSLTSMRDRHYVGERERRGVESVPDDPHVAQSGASAPAPRVNPSMLGRHEPVTALVAIGR